MSFHGVFPITLTPFEDTEEVDFGGIDALARDYLDSGADGLVALGIMGEAHKLTDAERSAVAKQYIEAADGKVPVIVGCSQLGCVARGLSVVEVRNDYRRL